MADELNLEQSPDPVEPQVSETEQRAMADGWVPKEEWAGDPEQWRPAKEFLDRGELFKKIDEQKRELKHLRTAIDDLGKHHAQVKAIAFKEALATLRAQKKEALETGDADAVIAIDDRIAETREAQKAAEAQPPVVAPEQADVLHPDFVRWEARNAWYKTERAMKVFADDVARETVAKGISDPASVLMEVDKQVRKEFPNKFENPNRAKAGAVEGGTPKGRSKEGDVVMNDMERRIMNRLIDTGAITKEKYLQEFKARQGG